jgi:ABC-type antimicrobial peptide transport system permease subunit
LSFVSSDCFSTLGIGLVAGRDFQTFDEVPGGMAVAIVNQAFARKFFGDEIPIGRKLTKLANAPVWTEIVGVVRDVKVNSLRDNAPPMIYVPYTQITDWIPPQGHPGISLFLQVQGQNLSSLYAELHREVASRFEIGEIVRQKQLIDDTLVRERLLADVASLFGGLSLLLAGLGLYGIMSYAAAQRRQELGVRMALGAEPGNIFALMLRDSATIVVPGVMLGVIVASVLSHWTRALLYGLAPNDAATYLGASVLLLAASLFAAFIPAYRAAKADPMIALRHE